MGPRPEFCGTFIADVGTGSKTRRMKTERRAGVPGTRPSPRNFPRFRRVLAYSRRWSLPPLMFSPPCQLYGEREAPILGQRRNRAEDRLHRQTLQPGFTWSRLRSRGSDVRLWRRAELRRMLRGIVFGIGMAVAGAVNFMAWLFPGAGA